MRSAWLAWAILTVLISSTIYAESRPLQAINYTKDTTQTEHPPDYGNETNPLFVKIIPTPKNDIEAQRDENERKHKSRMDIVTIIISFLTAIILAFQLIVFGRQAKRLKETIDEMKVATKATQEAASAATAQTAVAVKEFISTHRPRLIIRNITIEPSTGPNQPLKINGTFANVGETPATITESNLSILIGINIFNARTPFGHARNNLNGVHFEPGGAFTFWVDEPSINLDNPMIMQNIALRASVLYFFGFVMYRDDSGILRRTAFCRRYNPTTERFDQTNDPDYEYVD